MSKYVLEILDGDQKGESISLGEARITIGRKSNCGLVIRDEKCSGEHAEIVFEGGSYVLRDLGSTNGTSIDGSRISEVALSAFDIVTIGRVRTVFKQAGQAMPDDDLHLDRIDRAALGRTRRGSFAGIVGLLVLVGAAGAAAWFQFFRAEQGSGSLSQRLVVVPNNRLDAAIANFEGDGGWELQAGGGGFDLTAGRARANSGRTAIEAVYREDEDGAGSAFSLVRLQQALKISSGTTVRLFGYVHTAGAGRASLRLRFSSSADGSSLTAATVPSAHSEGFELVDSLVATVPRSMDQVELEVLALHPGAGDEVLVDDLALVVDREASADSQELTSNNGRSLSAVCGSLVVVSGEDVVVEAVAPLVESSADLALSAAGLMTPATAGLSFAAEDLDGAGFNCTYTAVAGAVRGLVLEFPRESSNVLIRGASQAFLEQPGAFTANQVREVLLGSGTQRCLLRLATVGTVRGELRSDHFALSLPGCLAVEVRVAFEREAQRARELGREAQTRFRAGEFAVALDLVQEVTTEFPHDDQAVRQVRALRAEVHRQMNARIEWLRREGGAARFFAARVGYQRVADGISELVATYGEQHIAQIESLRQLETDMRAGIDTFDSELGTEHGRKLGLLQAAFAGNGQDKLAQLISGYVERQYPAASPNEGDK